MTPTPCIHTNGTGLCATCQADYDTDPEAYEKFGAHPEGLRRCQDLCNEMEAERAAMEADLSGAPEPGKEFPF